MGCVCILWCEMLIVEGCRWEIVFLCVFWVGLFSMVCGENWWIIVMDWFFRFIGCVSVDVWLLL